MGCWSGFRNINLSVVKTQENVDTTFEANPNEVKQYRKAVKVMKKNFNHLFGRAFVASGKRAHTGMMRDILATKLGLSDMERKIVGAPKYE